MRRRQGFYFDNINTHIFHGFTHNKEMRKTAFVKGKKNILLCSFTRNLDAIIGHPDYSAATISNDACLLKMKVCHCSLLVLQLIYRYISGAFWVDRICPAYCLASGHAGYMSTAGIGSDAFLKHRLHRKMIITSSDNFSGCRTQRPVVWWQWQAGEPLLRELLAYPMFSTR